MITSPYDKYRQSSVQTSTPSQLLLMLYDGAIRFVRGGIEGIKEGDYDKVNTLLNKAQSIVTELTVTLDYSYEVSKGLASLYEYINHLLIDANIKKTAPPAEEALGYLLDLRDTWAQAAKLAGGGVPESSNG
ncbi:flagellar export chaperone FliS [Paenibacillus fonticola]|uniref:flagellar export chaperone FliS n=1 Tax=Paenibacillus fonticola TaxID=379896 RepID=UPI000376A0D1|nr:flagellar export chaperone FliS [Paenibacillus fonticola]